MIFRLSSIAIFAIIFLSACSSGVTVTYDVDKDTDFSKYKTFNFLGWQEDSQLLMSEFDRRRMREAFKKEFDRRDLTFVEADGDMAISLYLIVSEETSVTGYTSHYGVSGYGGYGYYPYGGPGMSVGVSSTDYQVNNYKKGTLIMDVFDGQTKKQVWQGVVQKTIDEDISKREKNIFYAIERLMARFPIRALDD